jgi:hypothetical protein
MASKSITILYPYFGKFPEWAELFFETIKRNSSINFVFYTDCDCSGFEAPNITFNKMSLKEYVEKVNRKLDIKFNPINGYKTCDLRPMFGAIHYDDIKDVDYYGYADLDLFMGDIRSFYTNDILEKHDVFSTHEKLLSGHFSLFRNTNFIRNMYREIGGWKEKVESQSITGIDESFIHTISKCKISRKFLNYDISWRILKPLTLKIYLKEQYTTPFSPYPWIDGTVNSAQPATWFYIDGKITNSRDRSRNFMYLHFMNFKSGKYRHDQSIAPWEGKQKICFATAKDLKNGRVIGKEGIFPLKKKSQ